jgi:hypothetical protein
MRALPSAMLLAAGLHLAVVTAPVGAWAQGPQPVPYPTAPPPVPYGQPAPAPSPAAGTHAAAPAGSDVIYMKNGGMLRGTIIDAIPGAQARIELATGEIATVPWQDISRIEHGATPRPSPTPTQQAPGWHAQQPPPAPRTSGEMVWVHIEGSDEARLEQDATGRGGWQQVCSAPCDMQLPNDKDYRITGGGMKSSRVFHLAGHTGDHETVTVSPGSKGWLVVGIVLLPIAGLTMFVGLIAGLVGSFAEAAGDRNGAGLASGGWTAFGVGTAALIGGIVLIVSNAKTGISQDVQAAQTGLLLRSDAWKNVPRPTWKEASPLDKALPPVVGMPLLTGRF